MIANIEEPKLFIAAQFDAGGLYVDTVALFMEASPEPKESLILEGGAHGTVLFQGATGEAFHAALLAFLDL